MLLGCALFHYLLKPAAILCKVLQQDDVCVVEAIEAILKTSKAIEKLASTSFDNLPTVKVVSSRIVHNADCSQPYQTWGRCNLPKESQKRTHNFCFGLSKWSCESLEYRSTHSCLDAPQGWDKADASFAYGALDSLSTRFMVPLEKAKVNCSLLREEWYDMVDYAKRYLSFVQVEYQVL